jgi:aminoglycoside 6'-N-acetyltransferase
VVTKRLQGERVVLEPARAEHVERLRELRRTPEVERWWQRLEDGWPLEVEPELEKLVVTVEGEVAGFVQFFEEPDPDYRYADVDIFIAPERHEQGLGSEAMQVVLAHLFEERGHHRITLSTSPENARAIHVYEKLGFRRVGLLRKAQRNTTTGEWEDELLMELVL